MQRNILLLRCSEAKSGPAVESAIRRRLSRFVTATRRISVDDLVQKEAAARNRVVVRQGFLTMIEPRVRRRSCSVRSILAW
jgi:hypothetical protein